MEANNTRPVKAQGSGLILVCVKEKNSTGCLNIYFSNIQAPGASSYPLACSDYKCGCNVKGEEMCCRDWNEDLSVFCCLSLIRHFSPVPLSGAATIYHICLYCKGWLSVSTKRRQQIYNFSLVVWASNSLSLSLALSLYLISCARWRHWNKAINKYAKEKTSLNLHWFGASAL